MAQLTTADLAKMKPEQILALLAAAQKQGNKLGVKKSDKGVVVVYGLGRFPVSLYAEQWEKLLAFADEIRAFINANPDLPRKNS